MFGTSFNIIWKKIFVTNFPFLMGLLKPLHLFFKSTSSFKSTLIKLAFNDIYQNNSYLKLECQKFLGIKSQSSKWRSTRLTMKIKLLIISYTHPQGKDINWQNYLLKANIFISLRGNFRRLFKMGDSSMNILNLPESALNSLRKSDF